MRLPRRVPWSSSTELETLCSWIYTDEGDLKSKQLAINRLSAWRAITYLPHALESTLSLLAVIVQDDSHDPPTSHLSLRQSYSTAIIRLVNGLVDPLQLGVYARSIASIAGQLGLPMWLVELRHAATHEDLPSIELLREAARESMSWLLRNYFIPTLNPSSTTEQQRTPLRSIAPKLKQYKTLLKITTRDVSLKSQYTTSIAIIMKDIERWVAEAKVAASPVGEDIGWGADITGDDSEPGDLDQKERWALEGLCDALLQRGTLIPLSKKKRNLPSDPFSPPHSSVLIWDPLLRHLQSTHPEFLAVLTNRIVFNLTSDDPIKTSPEALSDHSYDMCLVRWALWSINVWDKDESQTEFDLRREITASLMHVVSQSVMESRQASKSVMELLTSLCTGNPDLEAALTIFTQLSHRTRTPKWAPSDSAVMDRRLAYVLSQNKDALNPYSHVPQHGHDKAREPATGWRLLDRSTDWKPCPIGIHYTG